MKNTELYRYLFGIESHWTAESVELDLVSQQIDILEFPEFLSEIKA